MLSSSSDVSGDGWGVFGVHVLRRGVRTSQIRLSDNTVPLFFGRPARAGRTLTVKGGIIPVSSGGRLWKSSGSSMPSGSVELLNAGDSSTCPAWSNSSRWSKVWR